MDLKTPALQPRQEGPGPRSTDFRLDLDPDPTSPEGADPPLSSQNQGGRLHREPLRLHTEEPPRGGRRAPAPDLVPLDLSERSTRAHSGRRGLASPQAALAIHPCPYCDHKTYYPEVLWVHKRIWHRVSCSSAAPQWIQPNGYKSIRHNLVFLARSGRTGPPPALGGKECQPLPIARFTRTQVPGGAPGPKGSSSPLNVTTRAAGMPRSKESHPGGSCALWAAGPDGHWQSRPGPGSEQHGAPALLPPQKTRQEAGPRPGPTTGGGFSRSATPTPTSVTRAGSQSPANSRPGDKYIVPAVGTSLGHLNKHSAPDPLKAKFSPQPQGQLHGIGDGGPPLPPQEPPSKAGQELRPLAGCGGGSRGNAASQGQPVLHAAKQESASEGHEKRLDILSIFKTYIPKDFASLYQSWGASGPVPEHRGKACSTSPPALTSRGSSVGPPGSLPLGGLDAARPLCLGAERSAAQLRVHHRAACSLGMGLVSWVVSLLAPAGLPSWLLIWKPSYISMLKFDRSRQLGWHFTFFVILNKQCIDVLVPCLLKDNVRLK